MYWINLFVALDRFVNALCDGDPDATVSARVGYIVHFYNSSNKKGGLYWRIMEKVINFAFAPIDGENHCYNAMIGEAREKYSRGSDFARAMLAPIVFLFCCLFSVVVRVAVIFFPEWKYRK